MDTGYYMCVFLEENVMVITSAVFIFNVFQTDVAIELIFFLQNLECAGELCIVT